MLDQKIQMLFLMVSVLAMVFVTGAETFGTEAQPVIQEIQIHDVTGFNSSEKENKDNLMDSITPGEDALNISKFKDLQVYRYDFIIENGGDQDWNISSNDDFFHDGVDTGNWTINTESDIWYEINSDEKNRGGSIDGETVNWDTSNGGNLSSTDTMEGSYIFETEQNNSEIYNQTFRIENKEGDAGSYFRHNLSINMTKPGELNVTINEPPEDTRLQVNRTFEVNTTVECHGGECGDVNVYARYNETGGMTAIPETESEPFYAIDGNPRTCQDMQNNTECTINWEVNATGSIGSQNLIGAEAVSSLPNVDSNTSEKRNVTTEYFLIVRDYRETTTFGAVDPNTVYNPALNNTGGHGHNITVDEYSQPLEDLHFKVSNLTSYFIDGYRIGPSNLSYSFKNDTSTAERASGEFQKINNEPIQPGETVDLFYWLDVPSGVVQDYYNGTATFVAGSDPG